MSINISNLATHIGDISLKQSEIKDWSVETGKQFEEETLFTAVRNLNPKQKSNFQKISKNNKKIEVSPPYYVYVSNISFDSNELEIFYHFEGCKNINGIYCYKTKINGNLRICGDCVIWLKDVKALIRVLKMGQEKCVLRNRDLNVFFINYKQMKKHLFTMDNIEKIFETQQHHNFHLNQKKNEREERDVTKTFNKNSQNNYKNEKHKITEYGQFKENNINEAKTLLTRSGQKIYIEKFTESNNNAKRSTFVKKKSNLLEKNTQSKFSLFESQKLSQFYYSNNNCSLKPLSGSLPPKYNCRSFKNNNRAVQSYQSKQTDKNRVKNLTNNLNFSYHGHQKQNVLSKNLTAEPKVDQMNKQEETNISPVKNSDIFGKAKPSSKNEIRLKEKYEEYAKEQSQIEKSATQGNNL